MVHRENEEQAEQANMLGSTAIQPKMKPTALRPTNFPAKTLLLKPHLKPSFFSFNPKTHSFSSSSLTTFHWLPGSLRTCGQATAIRKAAKLSDSAADPLPYSDEEEEEEEEGSLYKEKLGVVVKPMVKPRIVLKFMWMQKVLGIALNQVIPGHGTIPLSPYYFWPKQDAWDQLKILLEKKPWISQKQMYMLLNQATDVIMLWQETSRNL